MTAATREGLLPWADAVIGPYSLALDNKTENIYSGKCEGVGEFGRC